MKHLLIIFLLLFLSLPVNMVARASVDSTYIRLYDLNVSVDEQNKKVRVRIVIDPAKYKVGSEREIILTPIFSSNNRTDSLVLDNIILAGRNRWYHYLRDGRLDDGETLIFRAGKKGQVKIDREFDLEPWMENSSLDMRGMSANCCDTPIPLFGDSDNEYFPLVKIDTRRPSLQAEFLTAKPMDGGPVIKTIKGSAFVTFLVNCIELKENYMRNREELDKIINSIEFVRRDSDANITHVHIKGFASPEGPYENNVRLAQGRTETLRRYVRDLYNFPDSIVTSGYEPEDWQGLRGFVADSLGFDIKNRLGILEIIDGPLAYDEKNMAIQQKFPEDYVILLNEIYPWLRRSDYKVNYEIKTYTTLEEIRQVYAVDPTRLRNIDFFTLAQTYPQDSREYSDVYATAVEVYPDDPILNLNAAYIELNRDNLDQAQSHLLKSGNSPEANYVRGILAMRRSDYPEAIKRFKIAREAGLPDMDKVIERAERIRDHNPVTYKITPDNR